MSVKVRKENFINSLYPFKFKCNKTIIINFLSEIYSNYYKRCDKIFDEYSFQELLKFPMIVCNKIYSTFTSYKNNKLTVDLFSSNLYTLLFGDLEDKISMVFDIFDFDGDGSIIYDDVFLILVHLHLIDYTLDTLDALELVITNFFDKKTKIEKENCFNLNENYDIFLLLLMFINKHQELITVEDLSFYELSTQGRKNRSKSGTEIYNNYVCTFTQQSHTINEFEELEYKPTNALFDYLDLVNFMKKKKKVIETDEEIEDDFYENEDEDLNALCDFAMDFRELRESFMTHYNIEPKLITSTFSGSMFQDEKEKKKDPKNECDINKQVNTIMKNQLIKNLVKDKTPKHNFHYQKNYTVQSSSPDKTTQINSSFPDLDNTGVIKKTLSNYNYSANFSFTRKFNPKYQNKSFE